MSNRVTSGSPPKIGGRSSLGITFKMFKKKTIVSRKQNGMATGVAREMASRPLRVGVVTTGSLLNPPMPVTC